MKLSTTHWTLILIAICMGTACKKYVDVNNPDSEVDPDFWKTENSVRSYNWEFYNLFPGFGNGSSLNGDFYFPTLNDDEVSPTLYNYPVSALASNGDWFFGYIRKANIMLERIDIVAMPDEAKNHWKGVARFFRAFQYFKLVQEFGRVPWFSHSLDISDSTQIYKLLDTHQLVMDSVLADLNFAVANVRPVDQDNTITKNVALALLSRVALWEGTFRKYHTELSMPDADKYLSASKDASQTLIASGTYALDKSYQTAYNSDNLATDKEMILYKRYEPALLQHSLIAYLYSSTAMSGPSRSAVESYLCKDGLPIGLSPMYQGDASIDNVRTNRDLRFGIAFDTTYLYYKGHVKNSFSSSTGYRPIKFLPDSNKLKSIPTGIGANYTDAPLFWLAEVYLNYAEAAAELDDMGKYTINQADLDKTINKLRDRGGVAHMTLAGHQDPGFTDPNKDADVSSLIWEIRRERRVELMMDGFRFNDLMRWKKGPNLNFGLNPNAYLGAKVPANGSVVLNPSGYISPYALPVTRAFADPRNYLSNIPTGQILLYPAAVQPQMQNPGW
ncbi:MAG TPA: RagB/SusD family nutrient uptake outer membrane protein [Puia sp.]|nr:RagB/SusD family nutrient uptake outer membrane protein [Puia sp.]